MDKKIDIIIPAYNAHKWLENLLKNLTKEKNRKQFVITIVDDASKKNYDSLVEKLNLDLDINIIRLKVNHGAGYARRKGLSKTNCEYVLFLDSDDTIATKDLINEMCDVMKQHNYNLVYAKELNKYRAVYHDYHITGKILRRNIIKKYKIKSHKYIMEEDVSFMMSYYSVISKDSICKIDKLFYKYNKINENSITSKYVKFENYDYKPLFSAINWAYKYAKKNKNYWFFRDNMFAIFLFLAREYKENGIFGKNNIIVHNFLIGSRKFYNRYYNYIESYFKFHVVHKDDFKLYSWFKNILFNI